MFEDRRAARARAFQAVADLVELLTGPDGCPWDRKQQPADLAHYLASECEELAEALESGDRAHTAEEWGDVLFLVLFFAHAAEGAGLFSTPEAIRVLLDKMIRRHPHVFDTSVISEAEGVVREWQAIKDREKAMRDRTGLLDRLPAQHSALRKAHAVQEKVAEVGFDWPDTDGVWDKLAEEIAELKEARHHGKRDALLHEIGDLHFALVNLARHLGFGAEQPLNDATNRFMERFRRVEELACDRQRSLAELSLAELDALWDLAKEEERRDRPSTGGKPPAADSDA